MEGTFPDGSKLVDVHCPTASEDGDLELALAGSFLPVPSLDVFGPREPMSAGKLECSDGVIVLNADRAAVMLKVENTADRPIQVRAPCPHVTSLCHHLPMSPHAPEPLPTCRCCS